MAQFDDLLRRKYEIMGQQADAGSVEANARARLLNAQAHQLGMPAPSTSSPGLGMMGGGMGGLGNIEAVDPFADALKRAQIEALRASAYQSREQASATEDESLLNKKKFGLTNFPSLSPEDARTIEEERLRMLGLAKGIARVPGKGDGTKDTVKAKLAPGEAVLNKGAAELMGRGLIGVLNKQGMLKMGMA